MSSKSSKSKNRGSKSTSKKGSSSNYNHQKSTLNPDLLIRKATQKAEEVYYSKRFFDEMPLDSRLKENLQKKGFIKPTEIQDKTLEFLLEKRDILGVAQTGTGKTAAFLIPIIERVLKNKRAPFALIVVPTRELAMQIDKDFRSITKGLKLFSSCFIGGTNINRDVQELRRPSHVIIGTPRRILELIKHKELDIRETNTLVLDEFDKMLSLGFLKEVEHITGAMGRRQHTMLFSATLEKKQMSSIQEILYNPITVKLSKSDTTGEHIDQDIIQYTKDQNKFDILTELLSQDEFNKVLLFDETKKGVDFLTEKLISSNIKAEAIHGDLTQKVRLRALKNFKEGDLQVLIATDVAARGIDVSDITHVINYQIPQSFDQYIHRIGRTGRAGKQGKAFTFVAI
jgi:ATP-dependent RNA helicase RhlE